MSFKDKKFVCEVILTEGSPIHSATGRPCSRKSLAKRSAAFEACCLLRQKGYLDKHLLPIYHKYLPQMRNAQLALNTNKRNSYVMKIKPSLWEQTRGSKPDRLYLTVIELEHPENLGRPCQPLALLTRTKLPDFPPFLLHLQIDKRSNVLCKSILRSLEVNTAMLSDLTQYTLCIFEDLFNKTYQYDEPKMTYWFAPVKKDWKRYTDQQAPDELFDWGLIKHVARLFRTSDHPETKWSIDIPHDQLVNRFLIDKWDGARRFFSVAIEPEVRPLDPIPGETFQERKQKHMNNILDYSVSLWSASRAHFKWDEDQPVLRAERILHRLNYLDDFNEKEKKVTTTSFLCPEPFKFSAVSNFGHSPGTC